ncbi:MAG: hypothetical protein OXE92_03700 [Bacteroidetes bacterium]|nr:hypothetical protein [Bacteroidota bacterium]
MRRSRRRARSVRQYERPTWRAQLVRECFQVMDLGLNFAGMNPPLVVASLRPGV